MQCINSIKISAKDTANFLEHLKTSEFNKDCKVEKSAIKATSVLIYLELMEKGTSVTRKTLEIAKKHAVKQKTSQD
jgi:beta-lactamase class D